MYYYFYGILWSLLIMLNGHLIQIKQDQYKIFDLNYSIFLQSSKNLSFRQNKQYFPSIYGKFFKVKISKAVFLFKERYLSLGRFCVDAISEEDQKNIIQLNCEYRQLGGAFKIYENFHSWNLVALKFSKNHWVMTIKPKEKEIQIALFETLSKTKFQKIIQKYDLLNKYSFVDLLNLKKYN